MTNKYIEKIAQQYYYEEPAPQKRGISGSDVAKGVATGALGAGAMGGGYAMGKSMGQDKAMAPKVQKPIKQRAKSFSGKAIAARKASGERALKGVSKEMRGLRKDIGVTGYIPGMGRKATKPLRHELGELAKERKAIKADTARKTSRAAKKDISNKYTRRATEKARQKYGRRGALIGLGLGGAATLAGAKKISEIGDKPQDKYYG